jgi:hypothetical protein
MPTSRFLLVAVASLGAFGTATGALGAQDPPGRAFNPAVNPLQPDLIAFEKLDHDRRELQFQRASTGEVFSLRTKPVALPAGTIGLMDVATETTFSGDLDWRPRASGGRSWFAYVESDGTGLRLLLNSFDQNGRLSASDPLKVPVAGNVRAPRWSPDGRHLVFVSGNVVYIIRDVDQVLNATAIAKAAAEAVPATGPAYFPAWSPLGDHIAYQVETRTGGAQNMAIEVLPMDVRTGAVAGKPVIVTDALREEHEYRPSWSQDGRLIAFYVDRTGQAGTAAQILDIGIVDVQLNPTTHKVFRGEILEGKSRRRLAEHVVPNETRGPSWTRVAVGTRLEPSVVYVVRDEARNNPVVAVVVQRWLDQFERERFEVGVSSAWKTENHKFVSAMESPSFVRYAYVSVEGGGERVQFRDAPNPRETATTSMADVHPSLTLRSALLPGWGQLTAGHQVKGIVIGGVVAAALIKGVMDKGRYNGATDPNSSLNGKTTAEVDAVKNSAITAFIVAGGVYAFGIWDAGRSDHANAGTRGLSTTLRPALATRADGSATAAVQLGLLLRR